MHIHIHIHIHIHMTNFCYDKYEKELNFILFRLKIN